MAKIIYGVAGEGFGHSSRSHLIGQRLIDAGHNVMFVGSRKSLLYLKQYFGERVKEIFGLSFAFEGGRIDKSETLKRNLLKLPEANKQNDELFKKHFEPFGPELVISDFEPFSAWWAWRNRVPFISIDHEHMLTLCKLEHPAKNWFSRITASVVTECHYIGAVAYIIINFFEVPLRVDSAILAPPIIRPVVKALEPRKGEHILVYSTTGKGEKQLRQMLHKFRGQKFYVYGFDKATEYAGFSLISECLYLRKKMLLLPVAGQYEQIINAHYIEKLGMGLSSERLDETILARFLEEIDRPMPSDERIIWPDNDKFFKVLQSVLNELHSPISIDVP